VLLTRGAKHVVGVDVGRGQVVERLRNDARVTVLEGLNARHLTAADLPFQSYDLVVGDLSFISLTLVLPAIAALSNELLLLVKPQFELQPEHIGKGGLVKDTAAYPLVERRIRAACDAQGLVVRAWFESPVAGGDGNLEFFVWATR
jgi:23S rRNA (cytidine1920-2'-O)/16S rRNA (cytidine1409-2'-O)-methyltransferase